MYTVDKHVVKGDRLINKAKKTLNKYFADQNTLFKMVPISGSMFASYRNGSDQISIVDLNADLELVLNLEDSSDAKKKIVHFSPLSQSDFLISFYDSSKCLNLNDVKPKDLNYLIMRHPYSMKSLTENFEKNIELFLTNESILGKNIFLFTFLQPWWNPNLTLTLIETLTLTLTANRHPRSIFLNEI